MNAENRFNLSNREIIRTDGLPIVRSSKHSVLNEGRSSQSRVILHTFARYDD